MRGLFHGGFVGCVVVLGCLDLFVHRKWCDVAVDVVVTVLYMVDLVEWHEH